jgi:hypothetical protein
MHGPTEDKSDDTKDSFYKELEHVLNQFLKHHMKILLFNAKTGTEGEIYTQFSMENQKGRDHLEDLSIDGKISEWIFGE